MCPPESQIDIPTRKVSADPLHNECQVRSSINKCHFGLIRLFAHCAGSAVVSCAKSPIGFLAKAKLELFLRGIFFAN